MTDHAAGFDLKGAPFESLEADLGGQGWGVLPGLVEPETCAALRALYADESVFRSRIVMARHGFGSGEYQYLAYPLPEPVHTLRRMLYGRLVSVANGWRRALGEPDFPPTHDRFVARCHDAGQTRPTPLILRYGPGDFNRLHQDLYGDLVFPLQVAVLLSDPGQDFQGGEFVLTEQKPRSQSRVDVVPLGLGDAVVFAVNERPVEGTRGTFRVRMRHGVSRIRTGERFTLGIIFHDAA
ncbi:MAG: 2OG-Fe(II) oxygenase [Alphaproteobacteria bacterium]